MLRIFPAGLLLLLRLTYMSSHCSHQDCTSSYVPAVLASYTRLVYTAGCLEGPDQSQSCAAADCELAYEQQEAASASVRVPARYDRQRHGDMRGLIRCHAAYLSKREKPAGVSQHCAHLPGLFCLSPYSSSATCFSVPLFWTAQHTTASPI